MARQPSPLRDELLFRAACEGATSKREILETLGLRYAGGNIKGLTEAAIRFGVELPVYDRVSSIDHAMRTARKPDDEVFCEHSTYTSRGGLKKRLITRGLPEECALCGSPPMWQGRALTLQLDHINGVHDDHRIENLRLLCPNCHSQTETFCGSNKVVRAPKCVSCGAGVFGMGEEEQCSSCVNLGLPPIRFVSPRFSSWPTDLELLDKVKSGSFSSVSRELGVSDVAIRKRLIRRGLWPIQEPS